MNTNKTIKAERLSEDMIAILSKGGILSMLKKSMGERKDEGV